VLEAMALGTPLVTTHLGGIADMVEHERSALVVPPGDVAATSTALQRLVEDAGLRARLVAGGRDGVRPFLQGRVAEQLEGIYRRLAASSGSAVAAGE
jgi:phenylacetate-CoA ligase